MATLTIASFLGLRQELDQSRLLHFDVILPIMTINYAAIIERLNLGIRRAAVFMGLGINASEDARLNEYMLLKHSTVSLVPQSVTGERLAEWKKEFGYWVVSGGFRELVDAFCVFLDHIYRANCLVSGIDDPARQAAFEGKGLNGKFLILKEEFAMAPQFGEQVSTFYGIRNCLSHRLGIVGDRDLDANGKLRIGFIRMKGQFASLDGEQIPVPDFFDPMSGPFSTPVAGVLQARLAPESMSFKLGEVIRLTPRDLSDILFTASICGHNYSIKAQEFAKHRGVGPSAKGSVA